MENSLFRQKSIDRISSPEALHDYMRVTSPRLWMILTAVVLLLVGFIVYASTATMENTIPVKVQVESYHMTAEETGREALDGTVVYGLLPVDYIDTVKTGMTVRMPNGTGHISWITADEGNQEMQFAVEMDSLSAPQADGEFDGVLVLESTTPISFLWN